MMMIQKAFYLITTLALALNTTAQAQTRQLFDEGWQFTRNGKTTTVDLPHDWDIYDAPDPASGATGTGGGWFQGGRGEYSKHFKTPNAEVVWLHFEGVYQKAEVLVNGQKAGQHGYGYTPFTVDVTPFLHKDGSDNEVVVRVNNAEQPNCRWYSGSGIYRHVWMETMPALHIAEGGIFVTTPQVQSDRATVAVEVSLQNDSDAEQQATVSVKGCEAQHVSLKARQCKTVSFSYTISDPHLWSPADPYLYSASVSIEGPSRGTGQTRQVPFGIRSFSFDAQKGFLLNGKPLLINGACLHHDDGVLGAMAFDDAEIRKVRLMKQAGFNLIRTSHNPSTRAFLDACDSLGMLVIDEAFDGWRSQKNPYDYSTLIDSCYRQDIHAMVLRDRNHPSVICWSIGNEVIERKDIRVITTARQLKHAILECDPTRPVTEALCAWDSDWEIYDPHAEVLDVVGYNYMIFKHASDHQRDPKRVMWQTESFPRDAFRNWALTHDFPYIVGDIVWTGLDYLGESGIGRYYYEGERPGEHFAEGGQPDWHGAYCGDVDITGWRKPISHYRQTLWSDEPGLYMAVREPNGYRGSIKETMWSVWPTWESWTWPGWEGKPIDVEVYTKAPQVSLYLNDKLVGTRNVGRDTEFKALFTLPYKPGKLYAVAAPSQNTLSSQSSSYSSPATLSALLETSGSPARLRLTADRQVLTAGGQSLAFITVEVVDRQGRLCPEAAIPCQVSVSGQATLLAAASADLKDREPSTSPNVTTWKGRAIIVVRSTTKAGRTKVTIKGQLPTASISLNVK